MVEGDTERRLHECIRLVRAIDAVDQRLRVQRAGEQRHVLRPLGDRDRALDPRHRGVEVADEVVQTCQLCRERRAVAVELVRTEQFIGFLGEPDRVLGAAVGSERACDACRGPGRSVRVARRRIQIARPREEQLGVVHAVPHARHVPRALDQTCALRRVVRELGCRFEGALCFLSCGE